MEGEEGVGSDGGEKGGEKRRGKRREEKGGRWVDMRTVRSGWTCVL